MSGELTVAVLASEAPPMGQGLAGKDFRLLGPVATVPELQALVTAALPQVALLAADPGATAEALGILAAHHPGVGRVVVLGRPDFAACRQALRAGADEVLVLPEEAGALPGALAAAAAAGAARASRKAAPGPASGAGAREGLAGAAPGSGPRGHLIGFWSGRGGAGKTTLAAGTALCLAHQGVGRVLLVDLDLALGGAEVALDLRPDRTLADLLPVIRELEMDHLERVAAKHPSGLWVLCGGAGPGAPGFGAEETHLLLRACRQHFDVVVLDIPSPLTPVTRTALAEAAMVYYVVTPDLPALRALGRVLQGGAGGAPLSRERLALVLNRTSRVAAVTRREVESLARLPVVGEVRSDFRTLQAHLIQGLPLVRPDLRRASPLSREIARLAAQVAG